MCIWRPVLYGTSSLQIYGGPGSLSQDFKIWPILSKAVDPVDPSFLYVKKSHENKNNHLLPLEHSATLLTCIIDNWSSFLSGCSRQIYCIISSQYTSYNIHICIQVSVSVCRYSTGFYRTQYPASNTHKS